jgi:hypothetical protein
MRLVKQLPSSTRPPVNPGYLPGAGQGSPSPGLAADVDDAQGVWDSQLGGPPRAQKGSNYKPYSG